MSSTPANEHTTLPQIAMTGDHPRARRGDKLTSHAAADASSRHIHETKLRVLHLVNAHVSLTGSQINDLYHANVTKFGWKPLHFDTPRKRAGELAELDFLLNAEEQQKAVGNHLPETIYRLTEAGRQVIHAGRPTQLEIVLDALSAAAPRTREDIATRAGLPLDVTRRHLARLRNDGRVHDHGERGYILNNGKAA